MSNTLGLQEWLDVIRDEYLQGFIKEGGSSIKFAVPLGRVSGRDMTTGLSEIAKDAGYIVAVVNAAETRVHMAQDIFHKVAEQVPWRIMAKHVMLGLAQDHRYNVDGITVDAEGSLLSAIAAINSTTDEFIMQEIRPSLESGVFMNRRMARDFRIAMTRLCLAETWDVSESREGAAIIDWLTGANPRVSSVRPYSIYNTINRTNARHCFESLLQWTKFAGYAGIVAIIDSRRVTLRGRQGDGSRSYTRPMVMDHYELLREFIDSTDRLESLLMVVLADEAFLEESTSRSDRGMGIYQALRGRIADEVRDRHQANPMAALVRLAETVH